MSVTREEILRAVEEHGSLRQAATALGIAYSTANDRLRGKRSRAEYIEARRSEGVDRKDEVSEKVQLSGNYYVFSAPSLPGGNYVVEAHTWKRICEQYPHSGAGATRGQLSIEHDIPRPILEKLIRMYGIYKHDPDSTHERLQDADSGELDLMVDESLERKKHRYLTQLDQRETSNLRREVVELREEKWRRENTLSDLKEQVGEIVFKDPPEAPESDSKPSGAGVMEDFTAFAPLADVHAGMFAYHKETFGGNYDIGETCARLHRHGGFVRDWLDSFPGNCTVLHLADLGDWFHAITGMTEHGTHLEQDTRSYRVWTKAFEAEVNRIEEMRREGRTIYMRRVPGNHGHVIEQFFSHAIAQRFVGTPDVRILPSERRFDAFLVGESLHVLDHGYGVGALAGDKARVQAEAVGRLSGGDDYYKSRYQYYWTAHLHAASEYFSGSQELIRLPATCEPDDYATSLRHNTPGRANVYLLDTKGRPVQETRLYFNE